jgi:uncharacterized protein (DUF305 family)
MRTATRLRSVVIALAMACVSGGFHHVAAQQTTGARPAGDQRTMSPADLARANGGIPPFSKADVEFMTGMIGHHAQAVVMAGWAPTHGARADVRTLCERIAVAQTDEIATMQRWLRERKQPVPDAHEIHGQMMAGMDTPMLMPGMLTDEQLAELDRARGPEFDHLFLTFMIMHHQGAISMVQTLLGSNDAAQDDIVYRFASDVYADQTTEIERMQKMLAQP